MANRVVRADIIEVPLPTDLSDSVCMPLVVMQPTADASDYLLKPNYATNGRPGVVDHAVLADEANTVIWNQITNLPAVFPPSTHGAKHVGGGADPIPRATPTADGLCPQGSGQPNDYLGGDLQYHSLGGITALRSEGDATFEASMTAGATVFTAIVANQVYAPYIAREFYLYAINPSYPPRGTVHFGVYDPAIPGWIQCTDSVDISVLNNSKAMLRPPLNSAAMTRIWSAPANSLQYRLILDTPGGVQAFMRVGAIFTVLALTNPIP
jgi:hypothetical protein